MLLIIDNYDSFTFNLFQYFSELGQDVVVKRNDEISLEQISTLSPDYLVISPGPCTPSDAGISLSVIKQFAGKIPILGVCLGHQSIAQVFGGNVIKAKKMMHGKTSKIQHKGKGVFTGLNNPLTVTRYHSLIVETLTLSDEFEITAWTEDDKGEFDEIMAFKHKSLALEGVQFHPESILTEQGKELLNNFLLRN
ncbi:anthranilate synthase component II [Moritella viscosa]|uniref:Para-aminobenzoate synthase component II n=1 Tax=Moritella viscosa TaxID=80854 RepID=A0A090I9D8_9GAMM|nr:aminodeoxychorismate/anthranilate synthase component II [Moritella viscosa]CED58321.1 para-aminobenzoate synthase glutamine amidotransferase, component II [Moritella viscosa]SGY81208.1 Para-aminobenzoate synthase component II [Moritella viscosa]SGY81225.1 Para-aminobenzoate synthase component II [Moritella viscosa]SGY81232.1 Para-aminobenzoate synthase component II [Moritella viscosa]SGY81241.1 Para-aminobenzoate synthase component II [Moritella viscosa]